MKYIKIDRKFVKKINKKICEAVMTTMLLLFSL